VTREDGAKDFVVVANLEDQYSIWPVGRDVPAGWRLTGPEGTRDECLSYISNHWTDLRPLSLRRQMDGTDPPPTPE
jgi:MbtH protein